MNHSLIVSKSVDINAEPSKVWNTLTNPDIIKECLFGIETITDWKVGSEIIFQGEYEGHKYKDRGVVHENSLNKLLGYSYWSGFSGLEDKPENYSLVTYALTESNNIAKLTWTHKGYASEEGHKHSDRAMYEFLVKIKKIVERQQTVSA